MSIGRVLSSTQGDDVGAYLEPPFELAGNEQVLVDTRPFPLAYVQFYLPSSYLFVLSMVLLFLREKLPIENLVLYYAALGVLIVGPAAAYSFLKLNLRYVINGVLAIVMAVAITHFIFKFLGKGQLPQTWFSTHTELLWLALFGLAGLLSAELYRRSHRYIVTNARIFTHAGIFAPDERTVPLAKVTDLELDRHIIGHIFRYGTVIPLTASGVGMGTDFAAVSGTAGKQWKIFGHPRWVSP